MFRFRTVALAPLLLLVSVAGADDVPLSSWSAPPFWKAPSPASEDASTSDLKSSRHALEVLTSPLPFVAVTPCRVADTRAGSGFTGEFGPPALDAQVTRPFTIGGQCGIPASAQAVSFLFTTVNQTGNGSLRAFPVGAALPTVGGAVVSWAATTPGAVIDAAVEPVGGLPGQLNVNLNGPVGTTVDLVLDVNGYYDSVGIVNRLNTLNGDVTLDVGPDLTLTPSGQTLLLGTNSSNLNLGSTLVRRDLSGNFSAGTITASVAGAASLNVLKVGDTMTGTLAISSGNINLVTQPSTAASGGVLKNGMRFLHDGGNASNTFVGVNAGNFTMTEIFNTGCGSFTLTANTLGGGNTAIGGNALSANTEGRTNTAVGIGALAANTIGSDNTALGSFALGQVTGSSNIGVGKYAGQSLTTGNDNIDIGNQGVAAESGTIRIGTVGTQTATFIAGISGATAAGGTAVFVDGSGQLGTLTSSARFKDGINDMGRASDGLFKLRPVSFRYKPEIDPTGLPQYGLVAEEVAEVYPDLVISDAEGRPETVRYHLLVPMLLNEAQKDRRTIERQGIEIGDLKARLERLEARLQATRSGSREDK